MKRKQVKKACVNCQRAHACCGDERPCQRCITLGIEADCFDVMRKKRGRKRKNTFSEMESVLEPVHELEGVILPPRPSNSNNNNNNASTSSTGGRLVSANIADLSGHFELNGPRKTRQTARKSLPPQQQSKFEYDEEEDDDDGDADYDPFQQQQHQTPRPAKQMRPTTYPRQQQPRIDDMNDEQYIATLHRAERVAAARRLRANSQSSFEEDGNEDDADDADYNDEDEYIPPEGTASVVRQRPRSNQHHQRQRSNIVGTSNAAPIPGRKPIDNNNNNATIPPTSAAAAAAYQIAAQHLYNNNSNNNTITAINDKDETDLEDISHIFNHPRNKHNQQQQQQLLQQPPPQVTSPGASLDIVSFDDPYYEAINKQAFPLLFTTPSPAANNASTTTTQQQQQQQQQQQAAVKTCAPNNSSSSSSSSSSKPAAWATSFDELIQTPPSVGFADQNPTMGTFSLPSALDGGNSTSNASASAAAAAAATVAPSNSSNSQLSSSISDIIAHAASSASSFQSALIDELIKLKRNNDAQAMEILRIKQENEALRRQLAEASEQNKRDFESKFNAVAYEQAFEKTSVSILFCSLDGHILGWNKACRQLFGYEEHDLFSRVWTWRDLVHSENWKNCVDLFYKHVFASPSKNYKTQYKCIRHNGEIFYANCSISIVCDAQSNPLFSVTHVLHVVNDPSELKAISTSPPITLTLASPSPPTAASMMTMTSPSSSSSSSSSVLSATPSPPSTTSPTPPTTTGAAATSPTTTTAMHR